MADTTNFPSGLPTTYTSGGWQEDTQLIALRGGDRVGRPYFAQLMWRPPDGDPSVEAAHARYAIDDQIKIVAIVAEESNAEYVVFEGTIQRFSTDLKHEGADAFGLPREREGVFFTAFADPWRDDVTDKHVITGRWWLPNGGTFDSRAPIILRSRTVPPVFNLGGRPNMTDSGYTFTPVVGRLTDCRAFTHEDDPDAKFWTVGAAIKSILGYWLYGLDSTAYPGNDQEELDRFVDVHTTTAAALNSGSADAMFAGLDKVLPEIDVSRMGPIQAVQAICRQTGFVCSVLALPTSLGIHDTRYVLSIRRRHTGRSVTLNLSPRGDYDGPGIDAATFHSTNDFNQLSVMTDGEGVRNIVSVAGESYIEARFLLFPLWEDDEESTGTLTDDDQLRKPEGAESDYRSKHVAGGSSFDDYAHVGRRWGIACSTNEPHKTSPSAYDITEDVSWDENIGFDFVGYLGLNATSAFKSARTAAGVSEDVTWSNRVRRLLPMMSKAAADAGIEYVLEVSEDGGSNWTRIDQAGSIFSTLRDQCGIFLRIPNLAVANTAFLLSGDSDDAPGLTDNWWAMIRDGSADLRFAITAVIPTDHGLRAEADRQSTSGVASRRKIVVDAPVEEVWIHEAAGVSGAGAGSGWTREVGGMAAPTSGESSNVALDYAGRVQDALDDLLTSGVVHVDFLELDRFELGTDVIPQIAGRNISFEAGDSSSRYPMIVGIDYSFLPMSQGGQSMRIVLEDSRMLEGGGKTV